MSSAQVVATLLPNQALRESRSKQRMKLVQQELFDSAPMWKDIKGDRAEESKGSLTNMSRSRTMVFALLSGLLLMPYLLPIAAAQIPRINDPWPPPLISDDPPGATFMQGPIGPGQGFYIYIEDRNGMRKTVIYPTDEPYYLLIQTPPGTFSNRAWCIVYYPPTQTLSNWLVQAQLLGSAGLHRLGPFHASPGDPTGVYALRIGLRYLDSSGTRHWGDQIIFFTYSPSVVTSQTQPTTIITTQTTTGDSNLMIFGFSAIIAAIVVVGVVIAMSTRRRAPSAQTVVQPFPSAPYVVHGPPRIYAPPRVTVGPRPSDRIVCFGCGSTYSADLSYCPQCGRPR